MIVAREPSPPATAPRSLAIWHGGLETPLRSFANDHAMAACAALDAARAYARVWWREQPTLSVGRYHRIAAGAVGLHRRLSGGRVVPLGPGVLAITYVLPSVAWLGDGLRPEQVLNRGLRPLLSALRSLGIDAFYPGRDVVTADGSSLLYAAFTRLPDGIVMIEQLLAVTTPFSLLDDLLAKLDPAGVAGVDRRAFRGSTTLAEQTENVPAAEAWPQLIALAAEECYGCASSATMDAPPEIARVVCADESAWQSFQGERGPVEPDRASVAEVAMLGVVEVSARLVDGRIHDLEICGDIMAPFTTLEDVAAACENVAASGSAAEAVRRVLAAPDAFALGVRDLASLVARLR